MHIEDLEEPIERRRRRELLRLRNYPGRAFSIHEDVVMKTWHLNPMVLLLCWIVALLECLVDAAGYNLKQ